MNARVVSFASGPDLLTARPWAERGSCFTRDLFFFLFFFVGDQTRPNRDRDF